MKYLLTVAIALITFSCASIDRTRVTRFEPYKSNGEQQQFKYFAQASFSYPEATKEGEDQRMEWLKVWLSENRLCPSGFSITERKVVEASTWQFDIQHIYYTGKCQ